MSKVRPSKSRLSLSSLCKDQKMKLKVHLLKNNQLEINVDKLDTGDWMVLNKSLKMNKTSLHAIKVRSEVITRNLMNNRKKIDGITKEYNTFKEPSFSNFIESVAACMINSDLFVSLSLNGLPLNSNNIEILKTGIEMQKNLQKLDLTNCKMSKSDIISLCNAISMHTGLTLINLSGCGLDFGGAKCVSDIIRKQKLARYGETWKQSLRYRVPNPEIVPGLLRITLNNNPKIGDEGFEAIIHELQDDLWIKALDFQNCGLTIQSSQCAHELFQTNNTLIILDVSKNNLPCEVVRNIVNCLKSNNSTSDATMFDWLSSSITQETQKNTESFYSNSNSINFFTKKIPQNFENYITPTKSCLFSSELERTRFMLKKVSSSLIEERAKRHAIEEKNNRFKEQLAEIRSYVERVKSMKQKTDDRSPNISSNDENNNMPVNDKKLKIQVYNKQNYNISSDHGTKNSGLLLILPVRNDNKLSNNKTNKNILCKKQINRNKMAYIKINDT